MCLCVVVCWDVSDKHLYFSFQSKKHANKVRRYLSIQNEKEPALKKLKSSSSDSVSKKHSVVTVNVSASPNSFNHSNQHEEKLQLDAKVYFFEVKR